MPLGGLLTFVGNDVITWIALILVFSISLVMLFFSLKFRKVAKQEAIENATKKGINTTDQAMNRRKRYILVLSGILILGIVLNFVSFFMENSIFGWIWLLIGAVVFFFGVVGIGIADYAEVKGKNWETFFWLSLLISPLVTGLIVATISPEQGKIVPGTRACPKCAEPIKQAAILCKHCGSNI